MCLFPPLIFLMCMLIDSICLYPFMLLLGMLCWCNRFNMFLYIECCLKCDLHSPLSITDFTHPLMPWFMFGLTLYAGLTMVTNVPFYSFKDLRVKKSVPFTVMILLALGIAVINIHPPTVIFLGFVGYGLSGYVIYVWRRVKGPSSSPWIASSPDVNHQIRFIYTWPYIWAYFWRICACFGGLNSPPTGTPVASDSLSCSLC